jgi:hypothetical protein
MAHCDHLNTQQNTLPKMYLLIRDPTNSVSRCTENSRFIKRKGFVEQKTS